MDSYEVAVIGGGGAGCMAYLRAVLNRDKSVLFLGDSATKKRGRATWVAEVDNMPGLHGVKRPITSTTASTLAWLDEQPELAEVHTVIKAAVTEVRKVEDGFELDAETRDGVQTIRARYVINATGIMDVQPHIGGSIEPIFPYANNYDVLYCIRCDGHRTIGRELSVIGHRSSAAHIAVMLCERYGHSRATVLTNGEAEDWSEELRELAAAYDVRVERSPIAAVRGQGRKGGLEGFTLEDGTEVDTTVAVVALGIIAYNKLIKDVGGELDENGRAIVTAKYESTTPGFFVVGDLVPNHKMQVYTAWDEAVDAADEINRRLRMERREARLAAHRARS